MASAKVKKCINCGARAIYKKRQMLSAMWWTGIGLRFNQRFEEAPAYFFCTKCSLAEMIKGEDGEDTNTEDFEV